MKIIVNGSEHELVVSTLAELLERLDYGNAVVATAVNRRFVAMGLRAGTTLASGDEVEIVAPMQGG